jgi:hypothetical protein
MVPRGFNWGKRLNGTTAHNFRPQTRINNIFKPKAERVKPVNKQLCEHIRELIEQGHLKSPAIQQQERDAATRGWHEEAIRRLELERENLGARADQVLDHVKLLPTKRAQLKTLIIDAMKWAQKQ